jgi:hypothetical protein
MCPVILVHGYIKPSQARPPLSGSDSERNFARALELSPQSHISHHLRLKMMSDSKNLKGAANNHTANP